jgi:pyruvate/2-oxoglutarate/acetoin dehydrogenase E1 component
MRRDQSVFIIGEDVAGGTGAPARTTPGAACSA